MENNETHIIQRILRGETALYEYFLNQHGQQVFSLIARIICVTPITPLGGGGIRFISSSLG